MEKTYYSMLTDIDFGPFDRVLILLITVHAASSSVISYSTMISPPNSTLRDKPGSDLSAGPDTPHHFCP